MRLQPLTAIGLAAAAVAVGAFLFGVWHVVVGGVLNGNAEAGQFGLSLAAGSGAFLVALLVALRRAPRPGRRDTGTRRRGRDRGAAGVPRRRRR